jgi:hypothetical protein
MHDQINHILINKRQHSSITDVWSFRRAECDTDHYLVAAKVWDRLLVNKQAAKKFSKERFNLYKLNHWKLKKNGLKSHTGLQLWKMWMIIDINRA